MPFLILLASGLLAVQEPVRAWLTRRLAGRSADGAHERWAALPVGLAAVYGGYFGAGLSVIVLAALGLLLDDSLTRLNALKQGVALATNVAAAVFFVFSGQVVWPAAAVMAAGALLGGAAGGPAGREGPPRHAALGGGGDRAGRVRDLLRAVILAAPSPLCVSASSA